MDVDYTKLVAVLAQAVTQASEGKGKARHAIDNIPFHEQPMIQINKHHPGFCLGQAEKKLIECERLPVDKKIQELLGAIVYIAGEIITLEGQ